MNSAEAVATLIKNTPDPSTGLPDDVFYYVSRTVPLVNVDLLLKDGKGRTLLSWRDDQYAGTGWHLPGGIVRFKETLENRIRKVAQTEIGTSVTFDPVPVALNEIIHPDREIRGHFISILYRCFLPAGFCPPNNGLSKGDRGYLMWHESCPEDLIIYHDIYREYIGLK